MKTLRDLRMRRLAIARGLRAALAVVATALVAGAAAAEPPARDDPGRGDRPHGHRRGPPPIDRVLEEHAERIGLEPETRAAIRAVADASRDTEEALRERLRALHREMREILRKDPPDEAAVMRQADAIGAAETEERKHRLRTMLEIRALLTPAQREALVEIHEERRRHREERGEPRGD